MNFTLSNTEKEIAIMLATGQNSQSVIDWYGINQKDFIKIKRQIFRKLQITRTIQILSAAIRYKIL